MSGEPSFGLIRPPGHHAGAGYSWGFCYFNNNYYSLGQLSKAAAETHCNGKRFAVLEGGYNHDVLGKNVASFLKA